MSEKQTPKLVFDDDLLMWITEEEHKIRELKKSGKYPTNTLKKMLDDIYDTEFSEEL